MPGYQLPPSEYHPCRARPARYRPARLTHTGGGHSGRHVDDGGFGAQLPGDRPGDKPQPLRRPHEQRRLCLRLTGEALGQPGPSLEHVIQTRM